MWAVHLLHYMHACCVVHMVGLKSLVSVLKSFCADEFCDACCCIFFGQCGACMLNMRARRSIGVHFHSILSHVRGLGTQPESW